MQPSNYAVLTQSHRAIAAKKRARKEQIKEVLFDEDARREFLTGFHKRKLAKKEEAKQKAQAREKQERLETRRERRRMLAERAVQNAAEVERAYGAIIDDGDDDTGEWSGLEHDADGKDMEKEEEYEGEEQFATVTVVEEFEPETLIHGPSTSALPEKSVPHYAPNPSTTKSKGKEKDRGGVTQLKSSAKKSEKVKKIRYQTKAARQADRSKQRARRTEKAERAGGKASRKGKRR
ncbi:hypothetical protein SERLA73DRAFT_180357 [Serpula lacrymans var. lacrymans S7.3]|uniref:Ribosomal RNA-processing protein 17 n=2 Tax=Serpula lacrymans var. lacrymans TaxID=341189 RepID=F8PU61_SERL3|nr:uncharacterized protein SERLADRAFT_465935 [Serpula lacrymans var. lacrymans S7.9]EGO00001.1 hypothetical protein SERLA73DRAFT_180357 [Serpula lacrymans var. lacrymans S7.3]EGO25580.1 hypothetical protein SERLADRAFT_465935 [Serpula lacrymans var. lacrymans S7.9]